MNQSIHPQEIEVKLVYTDRAKITSWLSENGYKLVKQKEIKDSYFSQNDSASMDDISSFYRIRDVVGVYTELTLKDKFQEQNGIKTRRELNVKIDDAEKMAEILTSLSCALFKEHFSKRDIWEKGEIKFEFIDYYKPTDLSLIEIEGPDNESIETVLSSLDDLVKVAGDDLFTAFDKATQS